MEPKLWQALTMGMRTLLHEGPRGRVEVFMGFADCYGPRHAASSQKASIEYRPIAPMQCPGSTPRRGM